MADKIKGLTVKIGADTTDFLRELKKVDKEINSTQRTASELEKSLQLEFDANRFTQAQRQVQKALTETNEKAKAIREQLAYLERTGGVDTEGYQKLELELAKTETQALKLNEQLKQIDKLKFDNATKGIKDLSNNLSTAAKKTAILSAAAVGAIAGIYKLGTSTASAGAELQDYSDRLGISAEELQRWNYIAMQSGLETEQLTKSMSKARDAIGTALTGGSNTATTALQALLGDLSKLPQDTSQGFQVIINALANVKDSTLQAYYANEIFGEKLATDLIPLINQGAGTIAKFNNEFEQIGYLSNEQVQSLADFDDQMNIVNSKLALVKNELGLALLPIVEKFTEILTDVVVPAIKDVAKWFDKLSEPVKNIITGGLMLIGVLSPIFLIMSKIVGVIPSLIKMFNALKSASWQTYAGIAALGAAVGLVFDLIGNWGQMTTLEKVLKSLALAALVAAAAMTVFHASWSVGLAVGAITAAVVTGIAAINSAGKSIGIDTNFSDTDSVNNYANSNYKVPTSANYGSNTYNEDNSTYNININADLSGDLNYDAKTLASEVIKQIQVAKQSSGR